MKLFRNFKLFPNIGVGGGGFGGGGVWQGGIVGKYEKKSEIQWNYARVFRTDAHTD